MTSLRADPLDDKVALITGAARRIGAVIAETLHEAGMTIAVHYRGSAADAVALVARLNGIRHASAQAFQADLSVDGAPAELLDTVTFGWILVRIHKGSRVVLTQESVNQEAWLPRTLWYRVSIRIGLVSLRNVEVETTYGDYRPAS